MATPTISGIVASNDANGGLQAIVTFSEAVTAEDMTGISVSSGNVDSVVSDASTLVFVIRNQAVGEVFTMSFATGNTITADSDSGQLAEALLEAVTNNIAAAIATLSAAIDSGDQQDSASVHTAVKVAADVAKVACKAAC